MRNALFAAALLIAAATPAFSQDICYTFHMIAMRGEVQVNHAHGAGWLQGYAGGCDDCWAGIGEHVIGGVPNYVMPQYDLAVRRKSYETATVRCLRDACLLLVDDTNTYELAHNQTLDLPSETTITLTTEK